MFTGEFSGLFAPMYKCPEHGEVWHVEVTEDVSIVNDEVYVRRICSICHRDVTPLLHDSHPVLHPLTEEDAYWEMLPFEDESDYEDYYP